MPSGQKQLGRARLSTAHQKAKGQRLIGLLVFPAIHYVIILVASPNYLHQLLPNAFNDAPENDLPLPTAADQIASGNDLPVADQSSGSRATGKRNAYAFLVAGCDPNSPGQYRGYLYNILAAAYILSTTNSKNDIVVMVRIAATSTLETLSPKEERWLRSAGCIIRYLPKMNDKRSESFYTAQLDKFQVLDLIEYERVLFFDSDIIPICNLDYLFEVMSSGSESEGNSNANSASMRKNLVIAWKNEPSSGGFFILTPGKGQLSELNGIIRRQAASEHARTKWPPFDEFEGWGHNITWKNIKGTVSNKWDFYGAFADQGLLLMWTKYVKRDVSIVNNGIVEHWADQDGGGEVAMIGTSSTADLIDAQSCSNVGALQRGPGTLWSHAPYRDFHHFIGKSKPWFAKEVPPDVLLSHENATDAEELWFHALRRQVEKLNLGNDIDVDHLNLNLARPLLGLFPTYHMMKQHAQAVANSSETE